LIYPGPDQAPWPSIQLKSFRDGVEDYKYFWLLRRVTPRSQPAEKAPV
jgi:hypothetical protein